MTSPFNGARSFADEIYGIRARYIPAVYERRTVDKFARAFDTRTRRQQDPPTTTVCVWGILYATYDRTRVSQGFGGKAPLPRRAILH